MRVTCFSSTTSRTGSHFGYIQLCTSEPCLMFVHSIGYLSTIYVECFAFGHPQCPEPGRRARATPLSEPVCTVGFHNFNLRIVNLRVSNPNKLIVDVLFDTMSDLNVPGSRPKNNEISEIDRRCSSLFVLCWCS